MKVRKFKVENIILILSVLVFLFVIIRQVHTNWYSLVTNDLESVISFSQVLHIGIFGIAIISIFFKKKKIPMMCIFILLAVLQINELFGITNINSEGATLVFGIIMFAACLCIVVFQNNNKITIVCIIILIFCCVIGLFIDYYMFYRWFWNRRVFWIRDMAILIYAKLILTFFPCFFNKINAKNIVMRHILC